MSEEKKQKPFGQICLENCVVPFGMFTLRGCGNLAKLLGAPLMLSGPRETYEVSESNTLHAAAIAQATSGKDELPALAADFIEQFANSPARESWKGSIKDTGRCIAHGLLPLSTLRGSLKYLHSGFVKGQKHQLGNQEFIQLFRKKTPKEPEKQTIAGKLKYALGVHRGAKDKMKLLPDDVMLDVFIWINPTQDGWFQANFVIRNWFAPGTAPTDLEVLTWEGKPLEFTTVVINNKEDGEHELLSLEPDWLMHCMVAMLNEVEEELKAKQASAPIE